MTLYFDDFEVGKTLQIGSYHLDKDEIIEVASRWDPQPFHIDEAAAAESVFGGLVASSVHLFAICTRLFFDYPDQFQTMAMLSKDKVQLPNPARAGDTLSYVTECVAKTPSSSKPDRGTIVLSDVVSNQDGQPVLTQTVTLMVRRKLEPQAT